MVLGLLPHTGKMIAQHMEITWESPACLYDKIKYTPLLKLPPYYSSYITSITYKVEKYEIKKSIKYSVSKRKNNVNIIMIGITFKNLINKILWL
jgi:hypothetical protein